MPLATDVLDSLRALEAIEGPTHRADPASPRVLAGASRRYAALADDATDPGLRLALLADAVRLAESVDVSAVTSGKALALTAERQQIIADGLASGAIGMPPEEAAALLFLASANRVELLEQARLQTTGMPAPGAKHVDAMEDMLRAATPIAAPFPRLLALEMLAAALWAREAWTRLSSVVEEIAGMSPTRWRTALHRAHVAFAGGDDDAAAKELAAARAAGLPAELLPYVWGLEARLAAKRGDVEAAERYLARRRAAGSLLLSADHDQAPVWAAPTFIFAEEPRYELSIELWRRLEGGDAHARFVAGRLSRIDPRAQWRRKQAEELGVPPWRPHDVLLAEVLRPPTRRVRHAKLGVVTVLREIDGGTKLEVALPDGARKTFLASALTDVPPDGDTSLLGRHVRR